MDGGNNRSAPVKIRLATPDDIDGIRAVDAAAWNEDVAFSAEQLRAQIRKFPEGVLVAEALEPNGCRIVGTLSLMKMESARLPSIQTWAETTDNGYITCHQPNGDALFGVNLSVRPDWQGHGVGTRLFTHAMAYALGQGLRCAAWGGRLPGLAEFNRKRLAAGQGPLPGRDYAALRDPRGRPVDDELRFYLSQPFVRQLAILPDYFPDPDSEDYGVLLWWDNPLFRFHLGWLYRIPFLGTAIARTLASLVRCLG